MYSKIKTSKFNMSENNKYFLLEVKTKDSFWVSAKEYYTVISNIKKMYSTLEEAQRAKGMLKNNVASKLGRKARRPIRIVHKP